MLGSKHFSTQRSSVLASLSPRHNKHKQQGSEKVSGNGNRRVHHIKAVIIEGKAHRCIHARVLLLQNGKQHQRSRWARKLTAGLEILHWISNWGMNEFLQAVCNAIECFCRVMERQWRSLELYSQLLLLSSSSSGRDLTSCKHACIQLDAAGLQLSSLSLLPLIAEALF